jgi:hypothetical protein
MARPDVPTIPDDKLNYYREQLLRELSHLFKWEGLPSTVPQDYLERSLVREGYVLYYADENIGHDVLVAAVNGYNRHNLPTSARTYATTTNNEVLPTITRNIKRLEDGPTVIKEFNPQTDGVLISNMEYGQSSQAIVNHYAERLALAEQAFDTNLLWANIPYIFQANGNDMKLTIEKMFSDIFSGKPFIITDKEMFLDNTDRTGVPTGINFIGKELMDIKNEIYMQFHKTVGIKTAGVDKAERVNVAEVKSNSQHTQTVLEIMLSERRKAAENINAFFDTNIIVTPIGREEEPITSSDGGEQENGTGDNGIKEPTPE